MSLIKGKGIKEKRIPAGCMVKFYPIQEENDLLSWSVVRRTLDMDEKWETQLHSHPNYEEYWFVIEGSGIITCGDEVYNAEPGDLVITPRGVPHTVKGDILFLCCCSKHNVFGQTLGTKAQYVAHNEPHRDDPKACPARPLLGVCLEEDVRLNY